MLPYLFQIYGPLYANCYGIAIAIAILVFTSLVNKDPRRAKIISSNMLQNTILLGTLVGIAGGRFLWVIGNWPLSFYEIIEIWEGGFAVLGAIIAIMAVLPFYLHKIKVPIFALLDLASIYAPLLQAISRLGCFLAGCCYGIPTNSKWGVVYTHPDVAVPLELKYIPIHPTQLYSSFILFIIFLLMYYFFRKHRTKPGQLIAIYLALSATERFVVDFWRADQEFLDAKYLQFFSLHQWVSLLIFTCAILLFTIQSCKRRKA